MDSTTSQSHTQAQAKAAAEHPHRYTAALADEIETRWQQRWEREGVFRAANPGESGFDVAKPKFFCLDMFPYPSGAGLHVGHPEGYTATDIISRYKRHTGHNVLHPMGWDAFGLPAEQYAIATGVHPAETTRSAIDNFRRQLKRFGFSYDWSREFATIDPEYYKWTQWIWLKAYGSWYDPKANTARPIADLVATLDSGQAACGVAPADWQQMSAQQKRDVLDAHRLAYLAEQTVNWCPKLGTVLANEEVIDGRSERGGHPVYRRPLKQWMFRITAYAQRLLEDLDLVDWPESTRIMQSAWIGRSEGAEIDFEIAGTTALRAVSHFELQDVREIDLTDQYLLTASEFVGRTPFPPGEDAPNDLEIARRNLPHVTLQDASYFVTWRTRPGVVLSDSERDATVSALTHWDGERCRVFAASVMPDHVHWIVKPYPGHTLGDLCESVKRFSATSINKARGSSGSIWDAEQFDHVIRDEQWLSKFVFYLALNPVRAGIASSVAKYPWTHLHRELRAPDSGDVAQFIDDTYRRMTRGSESRGTNAIRVYTTRPDTVFGATYMVLAPEHPLVERMLAQPSEETDVAAVRAYVETARNKSDVDRQAETKEKTGVFTGYDAINPATGERIAIWVADYVLMGYGHGAIMAVPGHDQRDYDFAKAFDLPIVQVVAPPDGAELESGEAFEDDGLAVNSANDEISLDGLPTPQAKQRIIEWLEGKGIGKRKVNYRLRDWLFSRQRYWGEPFPIVFDEAGNHYPVDDAHLPVALPDMADYQPIESEDPLPLLGKVTQWVNTTAGEAGVSSDLLPPETPVRRETNTMPGWAGSCWYYLRYCDPRNDDRLVSRDAEQYWMGDRGVDLYIGGAEHAVLHLLYARFWHKILYDLGEVTTPEPFAKLFHQGMITSFAYQRPDKSLVPVDEVTHREDGTHVETATGEPVVQVIAKMSKSLKNVINPDDVIAEYGADTFRLYEMYMGPLEASKPWNPRDIVGPFRFLQRVWRLAVDEATGDLRLAESRDEAIEKQLHRTIAKVGDDIERIALNTAIAAMIEFVNAATTAVPRLSEPRVQTHGSESRGTLTRDQLERFAVILSPFAPHMAEELWAKLGHDQSIAYQPWPSVDPAMLRDDEIEIAVQIMGKVRGRIMVPADADQKQTEQAALADEKIAQLLEGKTVRKVIVVPGQIVNIVAN